MTPRRFFAPLGVGINLCRDAVLQCTAADLARIPGDGFTHVRSFLPARRDRDMGLRLGDANGVRRYLGAWAEAARAAPLLVALHDCMSLAEAAAPETEAHVRTAARMIAAWPGLGPDRVAVNALNEAEGGSEAEWRPHLERLNAVLRAELPGYVLLAGSHGWSELSKALDCAGAPVGDAGTAVEAHQYWPMDWPDAAARVAALRARHGREVVLGELGAGHEQEREWWAHTDPMRGPVPDGPLTNVQTRPEMWHGRFRAMLPLVGTAPVTLWGYESRGKTWHRLNAPDRFAPRPEVASMLAAMARHGRDGNAFLLGAEAGRAAGLAEGRAIGHAAGWDAAVERMVADLRARMAPPPPPPG
jgi:hypothetical protein